MQTVHIEVAEDKLELFLTIIQNLKNDIVKNIKLPNRDNNLNILNSSDTFHPYHFRHF